MTEEAVSDAGVTPLAIFRMKEIEALIFSYFLDRVDEIFGFKDPASFCAVFCLHSSFFR